MDFRPKKNARNKHTHGDSVYTGDALHNIALYKFLILFYLHCILHEQLQSSVLQTLFCDLPVLITDRHYR